MMDRDVPGGGKLLAQGLVDPPFMSDEDHLVLGILPRKQHGALDHLGRGIVSPHGIERDAHALFDRHDLAAPVVAACRTGAMRQDRLLALGAQDDLHRLAKFAVRGAPAVAAHLRCALLRNSHGSASLAQFDILERNPARIHRLALALALFFVQVVAAHWA